ncbi:MAG: hypothetical protein NT141_02065 [candidate division WWE3 bacterium]|nr:hypothetical protein [candidate division WWE3 bacterium]
MAICTIGDPPTIDQLGPCFVSIIKLVVGFAGVATVIVFLIGTVQYITSRGDKEGVTAAKGTLTYAIIGLVVVAVAFGLVSLIDRTILGGTNTLLNFDVPSIH